MFLERIWRTQRIFKLEPNNMKPTHSRYDWTKAKYMLEIMQGSIIQYLFTLINTHKLWFC